MKKKSKNKKAAAAPKGPSYVQVRAMYGDHNVIEYAERLPKSGLSAELLATYIRAKLPSVNSARATYPDDTVHEMTWYPKTRRVHIVVAEEVETIQA